MTVSKLGDPVFMAEAAERSRLEREAQGLPPTVDDPVIVAKVARIFAQGLRSAAEIAENERKTVAATRRKDRAS